MKLSPLFGSSLVAVTLLALLTVARAQNTATTSSTASSNYSPVVPPPPPLPPPPPMTSSGAAGYAARGSSSARGSIVTTGRPALIRSALPATSKWTSEQAMNDDFIVQFNNTGSFGGGRMPAPTMRIDPRMRLLLTEQAHNDGPTKTTSAAYRIYSLELIGIAMHDRPVAFVVVRHKDKSASLNNRSLTDFEASAIKELAAGKQIVDKLDKTDRLVVGAVRAEQSCIACHAGAKVGDLLGAFSYHLSLVVSPPPLPPLKTSSSAPVPKTVRLEGSSSPSTN